jgi:hypothetical protein
MHESTMGNRTNNPASKEKTISTFRGQRVRVILITLLAVMALLGIVWSAHRLLVFNSQFLTGNSDPVQYVTGNLINVLVILAVLLQVIIYFRMATQNERLIKASEESAKVARDAFHAGEAPYFGIAQIAPEDFKGEYAPYVKITFVNGGKTPAWHFHSMAKAIVGRTPEKGQSYDLETEWHDLHNTFFRTNDSRTFGYKSPYFRYSAELEKRLTNKDAQIFMIIKIHYTDFHKDLHHRDFRLVWDSTHNNFKDYDTEEQNCQDCIKIGKNPN